MEAYLIARRAPAATHVVGKVAAIGCGRRSCDIGFDALRARFPNTPIFFFGHSAGAALALELAATTPHRPAGLLLVNPAYKLVTSDGMGPSIGDMVAFAWNMAFRSSVPTVDMNSAPSKIKDPADRAEGEAAQRDSVAVRFFSMRLMWGEKQVLDRCAENAALLDVPMLLVQGAHDVLVDPKGNDEILAAARTRDKRKLIAADGGHGSSAVETTGAELLTWLEAHTGRGGGLAP